MTDLNTLADLDALLDRATTRRTALLAELSELDAILTRLGAGPKPKRVPHGNTQQTIVATCVEVLKDAGRPLRISELHEALTLRGLQLPGSGERARLSTILWRADRSLVAKTDAGYVAV